MQVREGIRCTSCSAAAGCYVLRNVLISCHALGFRCVRVPPFRGLHDRMSKWLDPRNYSIPEASVLTAELRVRGGAVEDTESVRVGSMSNFLA